MQQTFTIIRIHKDASGAVQSEQVYPGFGKTAEAAIEDIVTQLGEEEDQEYQAALEEGAEDDELDALRDITIDQVSGEFQIYAGVHTTGPTMKPIDTTFSG
jgi:hypothetical protein